MRNLELLREVNDCDILVNGYKLLIGKLLIEIEKLELEIDDLNDQLFEERMGEDL